MSRDLLEAGQLANDLLSTELPRRFAHVQGVALRVTEVLRPTQKERRELLQVSGLLHDIGYASKLQETGFHPIDGARHLRSIGFDPRVVNLVAHHSCARIEARLRGLDEVLLDEFPIDESLPHDEVCFCDMTTSPSGEPITVEGRLSEIQARYGPGSIVHRFVDEARGELLASVNRVQAKLNQ